MLKIGIDGRALQGKRTGIGRYVFEMCKQLDILLPDARFFIYSNRQVEMPVVSDRWKFRTDNFIFSEKIIPTVWFKLRCGKLCREDELDIFWGTSSFLPNLPSNIKTMLNVHDLNYILFPETISFNNLIVHKLFFKKDIFRADAIITISHGTADKLKEHFKRSTQAIARPSISSDVFYPKSATQIEKVLGKYMVKKPYFLTVATWEPRKNLVSLMEAFISMKKNNEIPNNQLILVGCKGWKNKQIIELYNSYSEHIKFLGFINDEDLASLYSGADLFVFPSIYEGFGIPMVEANACGVNIVASNIPELREAGNENAIYVEPTVEGIIGGIRAGLKKEKIDPKTIENIDSWQESASSIVKLINTLVKK